MAGVLPELVAEAQADRAGRLDGYRQSQVERGPARVAFADAVPGVGHVEGGAATPGRGASSGGAISDLSLAVLSRVTALSDGADQPEGDTSEHK